jgi:hypothetical protein
VCGPKRVWVDEGVITGLGPVISLPMHSA